MKKKIFSAMVIAVFFLTSSCGTIIYPERRGQVSGRIDVGVAVLDGIGVLIFIIPGLIAFAVDFATGAIYLPSRANSGDLQAVPEGANIIVSGSPLTKGNIERILRARTGIDVDLDTEGLIVARLSVDGGADLQPIDKILSAGQLQAFREGGEQTGQ